MEKGLVKTEAFQGIPVRIIETDQGPAMPVTDIANALECSRKNLTGIIRNNPHLFKGVSLIFPLNTGGGTQKAVCLTRDGIIGILMRISTAASKTQEGKEKIEKFQVWARNTLSKEMQIQAQLPKVQAQAPALPQVPDWSEIVIRHLRIARELSQASGIDPGLAAAKALSMAQKETGMDLKGYSRLLPELPSPEEYISASEIGDRIGRKGSEINYYLYNHGYLVRDQDHNWVLTDEGRKYGKLFPYSAGSGHTGYYIRWLLEIMNVSGMIK